jgi:twinkle protein
MANYKYHKSCDNCGSSDGCAVYDDGSLHCFVCSFTVPSKEYIEENKPKNNRTRQKEKVMVADKIEKAEKTKPIITQEERDLVKELSIVSGSDYRGIKDETYKYFGVRHFYDDEDNLTDQYYPCTQEGQLTGYKIRELPKTFRSVGRTGSDCELFMQFKFNRGGKYLLLVEGEVDSLSAYQMFKEYNSSKGSDFETAVVSPTVGANSTKQIASQYKFFDSFDNIILAFDNDKAGQAAAEKVLGVLPKGKVKLMKLRYKDPNEYLEKGEQRAFISDFYNAETYVPAGVVGSSQLYEKLLQSIGIAKIPLPPFLTKLDEMLGGVELGSIGVLAAGTGAAKTTVINECLYYWLFNSPHKIGVVSLELTCGQYAQAMLSRHIQNKIANIKNTDDKLAYVSSEEVKQKADELFKTEDGSDRFMVIDERDGSIEVLQDKIEEMIISCGVKVIICDPVSDLFEGLPNEEQAAFMKWLKSMVKNYNVTFILIAHIRKSSTNKDSASSGSFIPEEAIFGSGSIIKSASWVAMMQRDKYAEDDTIRNTTHVVLSKNRATGVTGNAGSMYYCNKTHRLHDLDAWLNGDVN